ncbi:major facilitator superfamily domain-containing protein 12-like [Penaeus japonicus]|uniref:major facilitator superfamily domain-containing protein 12-like n=1 Tax=Penaeus japonicus TaxID=27405 RepID=UPI001C711786|nr:major facilitator superfamily domain-containing protein 12-like [Penaeus japonicus]XP_042884481.1 major facilitator superfamily domain-containing protein 12-like [Penaeus japonicus]
MADDSKNDELKKKTSMPWLTKLSFGVGHVFNDLCASMWFTYLLIFYEKVLLFDSTVAGLVLLVGQVADGLSTPIVGIFSDKQNKIPICARYGRRKVWHLMGTVLVIVSFPFIYSNCLGCEDQDQWTQLAYYSIFVCIFQFGWACVQISHLALIPDLTRNKNQRTELNSIRYAFTVLSNLLVFVITFFILNTGSSSSGSQGKDPNCTATTSPSPNPTSSPVLGSGLVRADECSSTDTIGPEDANKFRNIALICVGVGAAFSLIFHLGVREPPFVPVKQQMVAVEGQEATKGYARKMKKVDWFKELPFYQIAVLYMATRLYVNLYQVYIPLYVQETLQLSETFIATVPFAMYLAGFLGSLVMKEINKKIGRKRTFALGCTVGIAGCLWVWFGQGDYFVQWGIFLVATLLGIGGSTLLITSLSITADLIGSNVEGGAFVYGFMSLVDKFSNGIIIMIIQNFNPEESWYYRSVITFACGASCVLGIIVTISLINVKVGRRRGESVVLDILEEPDTPEEDGGIDNPALTIISDGKIPMDTKPNACQLRAEDNPSMCQLGLKDVPNLCPKGSENSEKAED